MNSIVDILDDFAEKAAEAQVELFEQQETIEDGLEVLKSYAFEQLGIDNSNFDTIRETSFRNWYGAQRTKDDLWLMLLCQKDGEKNIRGGLLNVPEEQPEIQVERELQGFGKIIMGTGTLPVCVSKSAYFRHNSTRKTYKARVRHGKVEFVKYATIKKILSSVNNFGVASFSIGFDINFNSEPPNHVLSTICNKGSSDMIDWVVSLMASRDILISRNSTNSCFVPSTLVDSDADGMCITQSMAKSYFEEKQFLYDEESDELFWMPHPGTTLMKVIVRDGFLTNSFELVDANRRQHVSRLKNCKVSELTKNFGGRRSDD